MVSPRWRSRSPGFAPMPSVSRRRRPATGRPMSSRVDDEQTEFRAGARARTEHCAGLCARHRPDGDRAADPRASSGDPSFSPDHACDVRSFRPTGRFHFVWLSPPCDEFARESMPWCRTGRAPSMDLVVAGLNTVGAINPPLWCLENVRGATRYITPLVGSPRRAGPFFLWGRLPRDLALPQVAPFKERLSSKRKAERARIPYALSLAIILGVEADLRGRE